MTIFRTSIDIKVVVSFRRGWKSLSEADVFIGYHADTAASLVLQMSRQSAPKQNIEGEEDVERDDNWANEVVN